jgi:ribulose 1,5-bisphosphate carboxylase large subunit-like protein
MGVTGISYEDFLDTGYVPAEDDLVCEFRVDPAEEETGETKSYLVNVTGAGTEMLERVDLAAEHGCEYVMVDVVTAGWTSLQQVRERCERHGLAIHAPPDGSHAGAKAFRAAVDAAVAGRSLEDAAADVPELDTALAEWGREGTR